MFTELFDPEDPFCFEDHFFSMQFLNKYDPRLVGLLKKELAEGEEDFVDKWRGKLVWREERAGDPRYEYLKKKYE